MKLSDKRVASMAGHAPDDDLERAIIRMLYTVGFPQQRIANLFDCNLGRINDVVKYRRGHGKVRWCLMVNGARLWSHEA
jgi:DNA-directed RNA polymerase specialized sigma24 family protein